MVPLSLALIVAAAPAGLVTRQGHRLMLDGREYRAVGVNIPHLHQAYFGTWFHINEIYGSPEAARQAMIAALDDLAASGLAFVRFFAGPGYPRDQAMLYDVDPERYWALMDELFGLCRERGIRLIPSLQTIPGPYLHLGEMGRAILDPDSRTARWVEAYTTAFVSRYRDDPTVLAWELVNEGMLHADVEMNGRPLLPAGVYPPGATVRPVGELGDSLNWADYLRLYREHAARIKALDPNHLVTSGDAHVRPECTSRRETFPNFRFRVDTLREWLGNNLLSQPEPLDLFSYHAYGRRGALAPEPNWGLSSTELLRAQVRAVHAAGVPILIGEYGTSPNNQAEPAGEWMREGLDMLEAEGVSLVALWVWHFRWQPEFTLASATHPELVARAAAWNRAHAR